MQQSLEVGNIDLEEHKSFNVFSTEVSSAVRARVTSRAEKMFTRHTIRIRYDDVIRPNTNRLFGPLFGTEANTNRIFGTSLVVNTSAVDWGGGMSVCCTAGPIVRHCGQWMAA